MGYVSYLKSPKMEEEQEVPDTFFYTHSQELASNEESDDHHHQFMQGFLGCIGDQDSWEDFMDWEDQDDFDHTSLELDSYVFEAESQYMSSCRVIKSEITDVGGFWDIHDEDDVKGSLKLNLNYQRVLDAWSDRGPLRTQGCALSPASSGFYMGEVPMMEEERRRREASVVRYKEKRQSRLFSKKIRYQVRKLNAEKRPRLKGRFVKRSS